MDLGRPFESFGRIDEVPDHQPHHSIKRPGEAGKMGIRTWT